STAIRHGFANVPCAEFQSELIREAYARAGVNVLEDFNEALGNPLIWSNSAAVVDLADALYKAGWVAWEPSRFRPPVGAVMMHQEAQTPGHTYIAAGFDGRVIVDNGSPQGKNLSALSEKRVEFQYQGGVFFLP